MWLHSRLTRLPGSADNRRSTSIFAVLVNFAVLVTPFLSDMPGMWVRQRCKVHPLGKDEAMAAREGRQAAGTHP